MDTLEYVIFQLRRRVEAGEMSPRQSLDVMEELVDYAARANEHDGEEGVQTRQEREQAYLEREKRLVKSDAYRELNRWVDRTDRIAERDRA